MVNITGAIPRMPKGTGTLTLKCKLCNHVHSSAHISKEKAAMEISQQVIAHMTKDHPVEWAMLQQTIVTSQIRLTSLLVNAAAIDLQHSSSDCVMLEWYQDQLVDQENELISALGWQEDVEEEIEETEEEEQTTAPNNLSAN